MVDISTTISPQMKVLVTALVAVWAFVSQQILAAIFYAILNVQAFGRPRFFGGYVQEYVIWRLRMPGMGFSRGPLIANIVAAAVIMVIVFLAWRWIL